MDNKAQQILKGISAANSSPVSSVQLAQYVKVQPIEREDTRKGYVKYGDNNDFPQYMLELYNESPVHGSLVNSISYMIAGAGLKTTDQRVADEATRLCLDKLRLPISFDLKLQGGCFLEVIYSLDKSTIAEVNHLPFENCRLSISGDEDEVNGVWYSRDWTEQGKRKNKPVYLPFYDKEKAGEETIQVLFLHNLCAGSSYYPKGDYVSSINWIELTRQMSEFHVNNILNGLFPSFMVHFSNGDLPPETKLAMKRDWEEMLSGAKNAGKFIMTFNETPEKAPKVDSFPLSDADKQYQFLSEETTKQIMYAHRVTSPLLFGIRDAGGLGSNTDEMKSAYHIFFKQVIQPYQQEIERAFSELISFSVENSTIEIEQNDLWQDNVEVQENAPAEAPVGLTKEQSDMLIMLSSKVMAEEMSAAAAKAIAKATHPMLSDEQIDSIFQLYDDRDVVMQEVTQASKKKQFLESYEPTDEMAGEARIGLKWRSTYNRGGTMVGVARARDISNKRGLSEETVRRMNNYFTRHEVDKQAKGWKDGEEGFPSAGRIAWQLWGGDAGQKWAARMVKRFESVEMAATPHEDMNEEQEEAWLCHLEQAGEVVDLNEWELVDEEAVTYEKQPDLKPLERVTNRIVKFFKSFANPDDKSKMDGGMFKVRYRYSRGLKENSRKFCVKMVADSEKGVKYRYEDIMNMSDWGVNSAFAAKGENSYNVFRFKGGVACHHYWIREIYRRKQTKGKFLPNKGLLNDLKISIKRAESEGFDMKDIDFGWSDAATMPIDMPNQGRLN